MREMPPLSTILRRAAWPLGIVLLAAVLAVWLVDTRPRASARAVEEKVWPVQVVAVRAADVQPTLRLFGEVRAAREAEIRALVAGRLVSLSPEFKNGNLVAAGAELALVDPVDYENRLAEQRAELARVDAQLDAQRKELTWELELEANAARQVELARRGLERITQLAASGRESKKARDDAEAALAVSEQTHLQRGQGVARLRAGIREQEAARARILATLANAERELAHARVVAPFTGHVADVRLALGQRVAVGERLARLLAADELEVRFEVPEAAYARLLSAAQAADQAVALAGRPLEVIWRLGEQARVFASRVTRVGAEIDATLGGIAFYASLPADAAARGLRAGAFVEIQLPDIVYHAVYRLPARALSGTGEVYSLVDGRLVPTAVEVVRDLGDEVLVRGALDSDHPVVAHAFAGIGPGLRARPL